MLIAIFRSLVPRADCGRAGRHAARGFADKFADEHGIALVIDRLIVFFGYFIIFEAAWNGQTPGKKLLGMRVVRDGGYPIDFGASLIRNLIRVGEQILGYYLLAAISMLLSPENKRLGDIAAGTIVVRDARFAAPRSLDAARGARLRRTAYLTAKSAR